MSKLMVYEAGDKLLLENRFYRADEVVALANQAHRDGRQRGITEAFEINHAVTRLTALLRELLMLAAYVEPYKFPVLILQLAETEAGAPTIEALAGELTKRIDVLTTTFARITGSVLAEIDDSIIRDTLLIRAALLEARTDDGAALRSADIQAILGTSVKRTPPIPVGRPQGMSPENAWIADQVKRWHKGAKWQIGKAIFDEINRKPVTDRSPEEEAALDKLKRYMATNSDGTIRVAQPQQLGNFIKRVVSDAKKKP